MNERTIIVGWPTIARLAHGQSVTFGDVTLLPDDLFWNSARQVQAGQFDPCKCNEPREVIAIGHRCGECGEMIPPSGVAAEG
jgi:hypothetical protein